jgi:dienelactone hydrolase
MSKSALLLVPFLVLGCARPERFGSDLHESPGRCGMGDYQWLAEDALGEVISDEELHYLEPRFFDPILEGLGDMTNISRRARFDIAIDRVTYRTQDRGRLVEATGMVGIPNGPGPFPVILFQHGTTGYADKCAPSNGAENLDSAGFMHAALVGLLTSWGYVVAAPDYLGMRGDGQASDMKHPYLVAEPTAIASLDMVKAARQVAAGLDVETNNQVAIVGPSQGGHAAALTTRYAPHYAADLDVVGAAYVIPPTDFVGHARRALEQPRPVDLGNIAAFLVGATSWYGSATLEDAMPADLAAEMSEATANDCRLPEIHRPLEEAYAPDLVAAARDDKAFESAGTLGCFVRESSLHHTSVPRIDETPAIVVLAGDDELVNADVERAAIERMCSEGYRLRPQVCEGAQHAEGFLWAVDDIMDFFEARFAGEPFDEVCAAREGRCGSQPG